PLIKSTHEPLPFRCIWCHTFRGEIRGDGSNVFNRVALDHDVVTGGSPAQPAPEDTPACENGECRDAAAETRLPMVDVGGERRPQMHAICVRIPHAHAEML